MYKKLSNFHNDPTEKTKKDVPKLDAYSLKTLENEIELMGEPNLKFLDFDFPCNDSSYGVEDFSDWVYFKRKQFHEPPVNMKSSFLWNPELVQMCKNQRHYKQYVLVLVDSGGLKSIPIIFMSCNSYKRPYLDLPCATVSKTYCTSIKLIKSPKLDHLPLHRYVPEVKLTGYRETNQNRARVKRAKRMLSIWRKKPDLARSEADATVRIVD